MEYIKIGKEKWVEVDEVNDTTRVVVKSAVEKDLALLRDELESLPPVLTDEQLIEWARKNYPYSKEFKDGEYLSSAIKEKEELLTKLI
jgi:hypothetical protein